MCKIEDEWVRDCKFDEDNNFRFCQKWKFAEACSFLSRLTGRKTRKKMKGENFLFEVEKLIQVLVNTKGRNKSNFLQWGKISWGFCGLQCKIYKGLKF